METNEELIAWFSRRNLPTGHFRMSGYETGDQVASLVELAIANMEGGNNTSQAVLRRLKAKLEQEPARTMPTP